jgi:hypothetical protein
MLDDVFMKPLMRYTDRAKIFLSPRKKGHVRHEPPTRDFSALTDPRLLTNPSGHHAPPEPIWKVDSLLTVEKGDCRHTKICFKSPFTTAYKENNTAYGLLTERNDKRNRAAFIMLHGWGRKNFRFERWFCRTLSLRGFDTLLMTLPFHQERAPSPSWSGEYMVSGDVVRTEESFRQVVAEVRSMIPWMENRYLKLGMLGISLGGVLAHLCMEFHPFHAGVTILGSGSNASIVWESIMTRYVKQDIIRAGITFEELDAVWAPSDPLRLAPFNRTKNILMINGKYDQIIPPHLTIRLWEALGEPRIKWYPCAHYSSLYFIRNIIEDLVNFAGIHMV